MDKEIDDEPQSVADTLLGRIDLSGKSWALDEARIDEALLHRIDKIVVIACGTTS